MKTEERTKVNIEMPTALLEQFKAKAKEQELSVSAMIRLLIKKYLNETK